MLMKNKTLSAWLALLGGPLGLHRFYLFGKSDTLGWLLPIPTALGLYGVMRARSLGLDDHWSWILIPLIGFTIAGCALNAIVYGLASCEDWNARFNATPVDAQTQPAAGQTGWLTVMALVLGLLMGATALIGSLAFSFQRYFEWQVELARQISQ
jgi:hypothetical protein